MKQWMLLACLIPGLFAFGAAAADAGRSMEPNGAGSEADLASNAARKAFLLNVDLDGIKDLRIESIAVDTNDCATIVVGAPGAYFFDRLDLGDINGILYVHAGDTLETMEPKAVTYRTMTNGKANIAIKARFIRAAIGFQAPEE